MKQTILTIAATALCIAACTNEDHISQDPLADTPIKLNVSVTNPTTRAGYSNALKPDTFQLRVYHSSPNNNDKYNFDIFAEKVEGTWKTYDLNAYRPNNNPNNNKVKKEVTMFWANMKDPVTVRAYVNNIQADRFPTDQSVAEQLKKADILYMSNTQVAPNKDGINVEFQHIMSKINLTIELGTEYEFTDHIDQKITDVKIGGTIVKISEAGVNDIDNINIIADATAGVVKSITPLCTGTKPFSNNAGTITKASASYEAILIPQTIASGKFYVSFKVNGKAYEWFYNEAEPLELKANGVYEIHLTAGSDKVSSAAFSTKTWSGGNGENGEMKQTD